MIIFPYVLKQVFFLFCFLSFFVIAIFFFGTVLNLIRLVHEKKNRIISSHTAADNKKKKRLNKVTEDKTRS